MHAILFGLGLLATAIGAAMIGYGIPINEFSLGNTLIIAGTVAATGGLVLIGLAAAVRQLRRIAEAMVGRPAVRPGLAGETAEPQLTGVARTGQPPARVPFPPKPPSLGPAPEVSPPEPRLSGSPPSEAAAVERGEIPSLSAAAAAPPGELPLVEETEVAPLPPLPLRASPRAAPKVAKPSEILAGMRPRAEEAHKTNGGVTVSEPRPEAPWRAPSESPPPQQPKFDALWPVEARATRAPRPSARPAAPSEARPAPAEPQGATPVEPPAPQTETTVTPPPGPAAAAGAPYPAAILKSGVVDGMAYTLYADGSIEAQLPQGMVRFGSIAELRNHIEQNS